MARETRQSRDDSDRRKPDRERDRDRDRERDRRRERDADDADRRRESDTNNRTRAADYTSMPNPTSYNNMPYAAPSSPPRQYTAPMSAKAPGYQRRRAPSGSSSGSSTASSLMDISRHYPQSRYGGFLGTFFKAPSERRRRSAIRRAARSSKRRTSFYFIGTGSSSSSSVNSDLAYGHGYIPKDLLPNGFAPKVRRRSSGGSNSFRYGAAVASGSGRAGRTRDADVVSDGPRRPEGPTRAKTDEEILEIGRQLSDLARKQNKHDLKTAGYVKPTMLAAAAAAGLGKYRKSRKEERSRGIGSSKMHGESSSDESDWEDASDEESDGADSVLAYGSVVGSAVRPNVTGSSSHGVGPFASGALMGGAGAAAAAALADPQRRNSVVDPRLFGPVNSLRGMINTPCGFGQDPHAPPSSSTYQTTADARRYGSGPEPIDRRPMREVFPITTSDPTRFDADATSRQELPHRSRTSVLPLEQPIPKLPVSSKVYDAEKLEDSSRRDSRHGKDRERDRDSHGFNASTAAGLAAAAIGTAGVAALTSDRKEDKKERKALREYEREREREREKERERAERERTREKEREREREREREKQRRDRDRDTKRRDKDSEKDKDKDSKKSKRDSYTSSQYDDKDHKRHSRNDEEETPRKRRETEVDYYAESPSSSRKDRSKRDVEEPRSERSRSTKRDSKSYSTRDDYKEDKGKSVDRHDLNYKQVVPSSRVDPFLYQVADGAFSTADLAAPQAPPGRPLTPNIVTVDREPNFDDYEPYLPLAPTESRLSRKDSFEIEERAHDSHDYAKGYERGSHDYEEGEHQARSIYDQAKHATIPVAAAAVASAIAVEAERSRERRRDRYDDEGSRDRDSWRRDTVQEEADRYYRESVIARKIEEEQIRNKTPENDDSQQVRIVTPPEMHERDKNVGPYDAPNADVRIDNQLFPTEANKFEKKNGKRKSSFKSRDPSCERDRPVLNLVFPTPLPSREPTPKVEKQTTRGQSEVQTRSDPSAEVVIGPKGDLIRAEPSKSVTWGENSTKSFEVESADGRSDAEKEKVVEPEEKPRAKLNKSSPWGIIAAAVAGSSSEPSGEPETTFKRKSDKQDYGSKVSDVRGVGASGPEQVYNVDTRDQPPVPGPKPASPPRDTLPGSFADDVEFAATLAAGLKDTGFDSNIVIDDPTYRRRDSPPGTREANGDEWNHRSMSDIVMDIANKKDSNRSVVSEPAGILRDRPANGHSNAEDEWETTKKLSKKDKKKLDKLKRQSLDLSEPSTPIETTVPDSSETPTFEDAVEDLSKLSKKEQKRREKQAKALALLEGEGRDPVSEPAPEPEIVVERSQPSEVVADDAWEDSSSKKKKKKSRKSQDAAASEDIVTVPTDAFDDLQSLRKSDKDDAAAPAVAGGIVDEWDTPAKSKRKSKSDRDDVARSIAESEISTSSKKSSSSKSKRRSGTEGDFDGYGSDASKKSSSKSKRRSIVEGEDGYGSDASKKSSKSKRRTGTEGELDGYGSDASKKSSKSKRRSVVEGEDGYGSDMSKKSSRSKHREGDDGYGSDASKKSSRSKRRSGMEGDFDYGSDIPSRRRSLFDDRDVSSVVSEARGDGRRREREKDKDRDRDRDRDGRSSKRSSRNYDDDDDARSVVSVASAPGDVRKSKDSKRSSGLFASIFKKDDKKEKESFLDNAGTLGAGVGLAGAAAIVAAGVSRSNATDRSSEAHEDDHARRTSRVESYDYDTFDPEIAPRAIKPAIDPQYGDLLPLPPSEPGSPRSETEADFPALPDSRPDTPPEEHGMRRDQLTHRRRRSTQETPVKSPSNTAIPISLRMGQRAPVSPSGTFKSPPTPSSAQTGTAPDSATKRASRGTSWRNSSEIKPLYLLEHSRHGSTEMVIKQEDLPALPPSQSASEISFTEDNGAADLASSGLHIDTHDLPLSFEQRAGSQESTPRAEIRPELPSFEDQVQFTDDPDAVDSMSKDRSSYLLNSTPSSTKTSATLDSEFSQSEQGSTPSKHRRSNDIMPEITEDLTSADERFEDALDIQSAGSRRWSEESVAMQDAPEHHEPPQPEPAPLAREAPAPEEEPIAEPDEWAGLSAKEKKKLKKAKKNQSMDLSEPAAAEPDPETKPIAEPDEWAGLSAKEKKKLKKAKKNQSMDLSEPTAAEPAPEPTLELASEPTSEHVPAVEEPITSVADYSATVKDLEKTPTQGDAFEAPKQSKNKKKNKKKSQSWEDDVLEVAPIAVGAAALAGAAALTTKTTADKTSAEDPKPDTSLPSLTDAAKNVLPSETHDAPSEAKDLSADTQDVPSDTKDLPAETEPTPVEEADPWELPTKKSKKKNNKKKGQQLDTEPESETNPMEEPSSEPATLENTEQDKALPAGEPVTEVPATEAEAAPEPVPENIDTAADAAGEWSTPSTSTKDKEKKKKKPLVLDDAPAEPELAAEAAQETPLPAETQERALTAEDPIAEVAPAEAEAAPQPQPEKVDDTAAEAADEWSTPSTSKKDKKKKKKKSLVFGDIPVESELAAEAVQETPITAENQDKALPAEEIVSTAQAQPLAPTDMPAEAAETNIVEADDLWSNPVPSKKDKKNKKKKNSIVLDDATRAEEPVPTTDDQSIVVEDTDKTVSVLDREAPVEESLEHPVVPEEQTEPVDNPEDEFAVITKDKKKKKKDKRKSVQFEPEPEVVTLPPEDDAYAPEAAQSAAPGDEPTVPSLETQDTVVSAQDPVFDETQQDLASADTTQTDSQPPTGDWDDAPASKKKGKKGKKKQNVWDLIEDSAPESKITDSSKGMDFGDVALAAAATEESDKKFDFADVAAAAVAAKDQTEVESDDEWSRLISGKEVDKPKDDIVVASHLAEEPGAIADLSDKPTAELGFKATKEASSSTESPAEEWPVATGKKGKKGKENKKSTSSVSWDELEPQLDTTIATETPAETTLESETVSKSIDTVEAGDTTDADAVKSVTEGPLPDAPAEPAADDADFLFPAKMSKKDKKKKKQQAALEDTFADAPKEAAEAETATLSDQTSDKPLDDAAVAVKDASAESTDSAVPAVEPAPEPESVSVKQDGANPDDEWGGFVTKSSKKDKKKKKNQASMAEPKVEPSLPVESTESVEVPEPEIKEAEPETPLEAAPDPVPEEKSIESEQANPDDEWDGFSAKLSKKDKKKKKKKQADLEESEAVITEPTTPAPEPESEAKDLDTAAPANPQVGEVAQPQEANMDDEFGGFTAKSSKKDKKKKKRESAQFTAFEEDKAPAEEPLSVEAPTPEPIASENLAQDDVVQAEVEPVSKETELEDASQPAVATEPEDEWGGFITKSSKKDKKKKKKSTSEAIPQTPEDIVVEEPAVEQTVEQPTEAITGTELVEEPKDLGEPSIETTTQEPPAEEEWANFTTKSTKKDKKKKKKSMSEAAPLSEETPVETPTESPAEPAAEQPVETIATPAIIEESKDLAEPSTESTAREPTAEDDRGGLATKSSKKDKKKKKKSMSFDVASPEETSPETSAEPAVEQLPESSDAAPQTEEDKSASPLAVEPTPKEEPEDEWGGFTTKSSKKDKKMKKKSLNEAIPTPPEETVKQSPDETPAVHVAESDSLETDKVPSEPIAEPISEPATEVATEPVAETALEAPAKDAEAEDEWGSFTVKSSKKDKKKKKKSMSEATSTPEEESATQPVDKSRAELASEPKEVFETFETTNLSEPAPKPAAQPVTESPVELPTDTIPDAETQQTTPNVSGEASAKEAEAEDEWMAGLSKKDKKKLKKKGLGAAALGAAAGTVGARALMHESPEAATQREPVQDNKEVEPETDPAPATTELASDEFMTKPMSKKDKKKAKKLGFSMSDMDESAPTGAPEPTAEEAALDFPASEPPKSSWADEVNDDDWPPATQEQAVEAAPKPADETEFEAAPISRKKSKKEKKRQSGLDFASPPPEVAAPADATAVPAEEPFIPELAPETSTTAETEAPAPEGDEWALPTKKGKKGKKAKRQSTLDVEPEPVPTEELVAAAPEAISEPEPAQQAPTSEQTHEFVTEEAAPEAAPVEADADDMWAVPSKKKGKKGKKDKSISLAEFEAVEEKPTPEPEVIEEKSTPEPVEDVIAATTEPADDEWATSTKKKGKKSKKDKSSSLVEPEIVEEVPTAEPVEEVITAPDVEPEPVTPVAAAEDEWALPTKKKGKKDKKSKSISLADFEDTENKTISESVAKSGPVVTQPESDPAAEEEWATSAKKDKGKKSQKMSLSAWEDSAAEPSTKQAPMEVDVAEPEPITDNTTAFVEEPAAMSDAEARGEDSWSVPVKKKSKKDKKRQSTQESISGTQATTKSGNDARENDDFLTAKTSKRDDTTTTGDERQERRFDEAVSVGEVERDDLPEVEMTRSVDDKFSSSDRKMATERSGSTGGGKGKASRDSLEAVGAAAALTGGVAALAQMYGGGKKKKGKKGKIVDKRQPQEDDLFDDPAVWEGPDKKSIIEESKDETADDGVDEFWGPSRPDPGPSMAPHTPASTSFTESGDEWKETARQGVLVDDEFVESPILGLDESSLPRSTAVGLLRRDSRLEEPVGGLFEETPRDFASRQFYSEPNELRSSPTRGLPAVQELPEAEKAAATGELWPAERDNRDSGFIPDSPQRRRSPNLVDEKLRDSGVDSGDWRESAHMQTPEAHSRGVERRLGPSPLNTPVLHEPSREDNTTPIADPEKKLRRSKKDYGGLATVAAGATALTAGAAPRDKGRDNDRRAVSDSQAAPSSGSTLGSERAEPSVTRRSVSNSSLSRQRTPEPLKLRPESPGSISGLRSTATPTPPPLRRVDKRMSGDLRALRQQNNSTPPVANEARVRTKDMADVYDGFGEGRLGSPRSPTRPHSMRRRQSMQVLELESRVEQLLAENRLLTEARNHAEQNVNRGATSVLSERDAEIDALKQSLQYLQNEVNRLTEVNDGLTSANAELANKDNGRYAGLAVHGDGTRSLEGPDGQTLEEKDAEIASLREQLEAAKEQVREMQRQILASKAGDSDFLNIRDEDYFDNRCQQLCSHVQQWVLRFSKFSDMRACRLTSEINDEKTIDRLDNAVLDGSDVDIFLNDRVKRRDIFMSMTMSMIWEFVFTRYLFGMDREQRQKLKSLEKLLTEVGPQNAVRQWRAVTLTLLAKRASFQEQRELDTEAVVQAIFQTLCKILPPPSNLENQIQSQLRRVMREAVDLSITMRTQRAEYMMLPPLQPEYDADGELAATVQFNASMMNDRSAQKNRTNEEIEADNSIVRVVLFPLVVKKGDDTGLGDDEIVVCPAQVLVAREHGGRHVTPSSDAGGASLLGAPSRLSVVTDNMLGQPEAQYFEGGI